MSAELLQSFYEAFSRRDGTAMAQCYHEKAVFSDPVFGELRGPRIGAMWQMLCERASSDFRIEFSDIASDGVTGQAKWQAWYTFAKSGRPIHNRISASFRFEDGLIVEHRDRFSLWRWAGMALGISGRLLGWTPSVQKKIGDEARSGLELYIKRKRIKV